MNYVTSDIHGCRREFEALLKKIKFSSQDTLYIIGDMIDRGPDSMGVLKIWLRILIYTRLQEIMSLL